MTNEFVKAVEAMGYKVVRVRHRGNVFRYYYIDNDGSRRKLMDIPESQGESNQEPDS